MIKFLIALLLVAPFGASALERSVLGGGGSQGGQGASAQILVDALIEHVRDLQSQASDSMLLLQEIQACAELGLLYDKNVGCVEAVVPGGGGGATCDPQSVTWVVSGYGCGGSLPSGANGEQRTVTQSFPAASSLNANTCGTFRAGSADYLCNDGTWTFVPGTASCTEKRICNITTSP